jgi:type IV secretory pathway TrbF-like protein
MALRLAVRVRETERERGSVRAKENWRRQTGSAYQAARARGLAGLSGLFWAEMAFPISLEFLMPFLFIFSRVFNLNSN